MQSGLLYDTRRFGSFGNSNLNWLVHDNLWLLSGILLAVAVEDKKVKMRQNLSHRWPTDVSFGEASYLMSQSGNLFVRQTFAMGNGRIHYHWKLLKI